MQLDQNPISIDYLNQIAPDEKKPGMNNKLFLMILGGALLVSAILVVVLASSSASVPSSVQTLALRLETIQEIAKDSQKTIKSSELRGLNSNLEIYLTNANRDFAEPLAKNNIDLKKIDKDIIAKENGDKLIAKLDDARLNATFDRTYASEISYQLDTISVLMEKSYKATSSTSLKEFLDGSNKDLQSLRKQFSEFNAANG